VHKKWVPYVQLVIIREIIFIKTTSPRFSGSVEEAFQERRTGTFSGKDAAWQLIMWRSNHLLDAKSKLLICELNGRLGWESGRELIGLNGYWHR
jgi:hypothetical protein